MNQLKNSELIAVLTVIKNQNITLSAEQLGLSQARLSKIIAAVEERFGDKILNRETRPLKVTAFGLGLVPYIENCIRGNNELTEYLDCHKKSPSGIVNIYSPSAIQAFLARDVLLPLHELHPDIIISLTTWNQENTDMYSGVRFHDDCDVLITYTLPQNQNLIARKVTSLKMNVFGTDECYKKNPFSNAEELSNCPFILLRSLIFDGVRNTFNVTSHDTHEIKTVSVSGDFIFDNTWTALQFCRQGVGYIISYVPVLTDFPELKPRLPENMSINMDFYVIYRKRHMQPRRLQTVIQFIMQHLPEATSG